MNSQYLGHGLHITYRHQTDDYVLTQDREGGPEIVDAFGTLDAVVAAKAAISQEIIAFENGGGYQS